MNKYILITCILIALTTVSANAQEWHTDLKEAKEIATEKDQKIILVFQGSDWCAPCIKLEKEIWTSRAFIEYADSHFVMVKADFPRKSKNALPKEQQERNNLLAEKYNSHGYFPLVVVMDEKGNVLGETGYKKMEPDEYIAMLNSFN